MDHSVLRRSDANALAAYLRETATRLGPQAITEELLKVIEAESLPPAIYSVWLTCSGDCQAVITGLKQPFSTVVRRASILRFGKLFRSARIKEIWRAAGDTSGVLEYLSKASVLNVRHFCSEIGKTSSSKIAVDTRQKYADELFRGLRQQGLPSAAIKPLDRRPLAKHHRSIFHAGSFALASSHAQYDESPRHTEYRRAALKSHPETFRNRALADLRNSEITVDITLIQELLRLDSNESTTFRGQKLPSNLVFAIEVLEALSGRPFASRFPFSVLDRDIARPLFRKLNVRKCRPDLVRDMVSAYIACQEQYIELKHAQSVSFDRASVLFYAVSRWSHYPDELDSSIAKLIRMLPRTREPKLNELQPFVTNMSACLRCRFLTLFVQNVSAFQIGGLPLDIKNDEHLKSLPWSWTPGFLLLFPIADARQLLERLIKVKPDLFDNEVVSHISRIDHDPSYLLLLLAKNDQDLLELATEAVEQRQKEATKARSQPDRCFWIRFAMRCAAASGSLDLYRSTLTWAKRYTKDPLTAAEVYSEGDINGTESVDLLCGFGFGTGIETKSSKKVYDDVRKTHVICRELFDTALSAISEPSFKQHQYWGVLHVLGDMVECRLKRVGKLQDELRLTDEEIFATVWEPTIELCLELEQLGLEDENEDLGFNTAGGPLMQMHHTGGIHLGHDLEDPRPASLRFLDVLAQRRDKLWQSYRQRQRPATLSLPAPYPHGLPLDSLVPSDLRYCKSPENVQYLHNRAQQVVFMAEDVAMSSILQDEESVNAVGPFIENWRHALMVYVYTSTNREEATLAAWNHALGPLSAARMSNAEAVNFWDHTFSECLISAKVEGPWKEKPKPPPIPELPSADDDDQPVEWDPEPDRASYETKPRTMISTHLDMILAKRWSKIHNIRTSLSKTHFNPTAQNPSVGIFWHRHQKAKTSRGSKDALIATVLLYISARNKQSPGLLISSFPSTDDVRIPAMYLDGDFMDREDLHVNYSSVWAILERLADLVPSMLLLHLINGVIQAETRDGRMPVDAIRLVRVLIKTDKPQVALELVKTIILEHPEDSSWQRALLTETLFNSLPKEQARGFLEDVTSGMQEKLAQQHKRKRSGKETEASLIKVTTIKMLSKLISGAEFVDQNLACQTLISILASSRHLDVLVSTVGSLLDMLKTTADEDIKGAILSALEKYAVPIMASINERNPPREQDWKRLESEDDAEMLDVYMEKHAEEVPPMLSLVTKVVDQLDEDCGERVFSGVLLPVLEGSIKNNQRWIAAFVKRLGFDTFEPPSFPLKLKYLGLLLLQYTKHIPNSILDLWLNIYQTVIEPPEFIEEINKRVTEDAKLRASIAGKHWLSLFGPSAGSLLVRGGRPSGLLKKWSLGFIGRTEGGLQIEKIQSIVLQQAEILIRVYVTHQKEWDSFISDLQPPRLSMTQGQEWIQCCKPIVWTIIDRITNLRLQGSQQNTPQVPALLPNLFTLQLWDLTQSKDSNTEDPVERLARGIWNILYELCSSPRLSHQIIPSKLRDCVRNELLGANENIRLALRFGKLDQPDPEGRPMPGLFFDYRLELAHSLLQWTMHDQPEPPSLRNETHEMIRSWISSPDEEIRRAGYKIVETQSGMKRWWYQPDLSESAASNEMDTT